MGHPLKKSECHISCHFEAVALSCNRSASFRFNAPLCLVPCISPGPLQLQILLSNLKPVTGGYHCAETLLCIFPDLRTS